MLLNIKLNHKNHDQLCDYNLVNKWKALLSELQQLIHWGRVTHICVSKLTTIGWDNGLPPDRRQAIIWTNAGFLLIGPLGTQFSETLSEILTFTFKKMRLNVSSATFWPFFLGLNVLRSYSQAITQDIYLVKNRIFLLCNGQIYRLFDKLIGNCLLRSLFLYIRKNDHWTQLLNMLKVHVCHRFLFPI